MRGGTVGFAVVLAAGVGSWWSLRDDMHSLASPVTRRLFGPATVAERVEHHGPAARERLRPHFDRAGVAYPPSSVVLLGLKDERRLELYAATDASALRFVRSYPVHAASGTLGPKLREGDRQVPEGIYAVETLNPNSRFHLSLRVGYPNAFDLEHARAEGRNEPGSDIMIHGGSWSVGCLAMGDTAAEELFVLAADAGIENVTVVLSPVDLRRREMPQLASLPAWSGTLYDTLRVRLRELPLPPQ